MFTWSASKIAASIRSGEMTSRAVVHAHIERIRAVNPVLNAVVEERFEDALKEADAADEQVASSGPEDLPPLHGVPCTVKEVFAVPGMRQTSGIVGRRDFVATEEATAVTRLRAAGAIVMGTTNVSELCMWMETSNKLYGRTNNPYDPTRIVGGSSGGEGAIVAAGASPFGLGSDIGGSIRMPAFFNGVFGHKPTGGLVPGTGQYPLAENDALRYLCTGPIARRAEDLMPLLRILAGPDGIDTGCYDQKLGNPASVDIEGLKVVDVRGNGFRRVSAELGEAQERAAHALSGSGADVSRALIPSLKRSLDIWGSMMSDAADTSFAELLGDGRRLRPLRELGRLVVGRSEHTFPAIGLTVLERLGDLSPNRTQRFVEKGKALADELEDFIGDRGVMLYPSYTQVAPKHNRPLFPPVNWVYTAIFNIAEMPVTQVPLGLNADGLPLGIQVAAARGNDHLTIAGALELEHAFGGWRMPPRLARDEALVPQQVS
ncbi:MAG: amidase [Actinomycetota bacterium]|nr:amidase [Actinomycetota bacterium]